MNIETGTLYEGDEIATAEARGEPLVELHGDDVVRARRLRAAGVSGFADRRLAALAKRRRKAARRSRVVAGQRRRGKR